MWPFSLFVLGVTSLLAQVILTRELVKGFYGNEFFIGWVFGAWLFWVALGSRASKFFPGILPPSALKFCHLSSAVLVPPEIILIRFIKGQGGASGGVIPDLLPALILSFLVLAPLCLILGAQFGFSGQFQKIQPGDTASLTSKAYFWETLGFAVTGVIFTFAFLRWDEFRICGVIIFMNALAFLILTGRGQRHILKITGLAVMAMGLVLLFQSPFINTWAVGLSYPGQEILESRNSTQGNLTVTRTGAQKNFYQNGLFLGADRDQMFCEQLVHLAMLSHPSPRKIFFLGTGFNGAIFEILKHKPQIVYYAEADPLWLEMGQRFAADDLKKSLSDPRLCPLKGDFRAMIKTLPNDLDMIIVNAPNPSTAALNRYYTKEFFDLAKSHLKSGGILSTHLTFSPDTVSPELKLLAGSLRKTIADAFSSVIVLPDYTLFMLASQNSLPEDPAVLVKRMRDRNIKNNFVIAPYLVNRYTNDRVREVNEALKHETAARINRDLRPTGYVYTLNHWLSLFHPALSKIFLAVQNIGFKTLAFLGCVVLAGLFYGPGKGGMRNRKILASMGLAGLSIMSAEIMVIYGFQVYYGDLYDKIAWIIAVFMAGLAAGTGIAGRMNWKSLTAVKYLHAFCAVLFLAVYALKFAGRQPFPEAVWFVYSFFLSVPVGMEFSLLSRHEPAKIYAADLWGSGLGSVLAGVFLVPALGLVDAGILLSLLNFVCAVFWALQKPVV